MAGTINTANLSASFDVTKLKEGMNATRAEINKLGSILRTAEPATSKFNREVDLVSKAFETGAISSEQMQNAIAMLKEKYGVLTPAQQEAIENEKRQQAELQKQKQQISEVESVLKSLMTTEQRYLETMQLLNKAHQDGIIDANQLKNAIDTLREKYGVLTPEMEAASAAMEQEKQEIAQLNAVLKSLVTTEERNLEKIRMLNDAHAKGRITTEQLVSATAHLDGSLERERQELDAVRSILARSESPQEKYRADLQLIEKAAREGKISLNDFAHAATQLQTKLYQLDGDRVQNELKKASGGGLLSQARGQLGNLAGGMLAGFGVGAGVNLARSAVEELDAVGDAAAKAGVSFAEMITLEKTLAEVGGVQIGQVRSAIGKMTINLVNARDKGGELAKSLQAIGLDAAQLANMDAVTAFGLIAEHSQRIEGHADKMQFATQLFGKAGVEMVPAFDVTRANLAEMEQHLKQMNLLLSQEQAANVGAMGDQMERVKDLTVGIGLDLANTFGPMFENILGDVKDVVAGFRNLRDLIQGFPQLQPIADPDAEAARRVAAIQAERAKKTEEAFDRARELNKELGWTKDIEKFIDDIKSVQGPGQRMLDAQGLVEVLENVQQLRQEKQAAQDEFAAQLFADEIESTIRMFEDGLRSIEQERAANEADIMKQSDQMQREIDRESQRKIGEADTNLAPAVRAGTVEAYKMMNRQNEDRRHRAEHMAKLDAMRDELRKFNERNTVVLSKRR